MEEAWLRWQRGARRQQLLHVFNGDFSTLYPSLLPRYGDLDSRFLLNIRKDPTDCNHKTHVHQCKDAVITLLCIKRYTTVFRHINRDVMRLIGKMVWETRHSIVWAGACMLRQLKVKSVEWLREVEEKKKREQRQWRDQHKFEQQRVRQQMRIKQKRFY